MPNRHGTQRQSATQWAGERARNALNRTVNVWRALDRDQRIAGVAALALFVSLFLPWFQQTGINLRGQPTSIELTGFAIFTFIEASVLLVAGGILLMLFARGERRPFHLPGGDGLVISVGGAWIFILLTARVINKPEQVHIGTGVDWGLALAFAAAAALVFTGIRIRTRHRPEPPLPAAVIPTPRRAPDRGSEPTTEEQLVIDFNNPRRPGTGNPPPPTPRRPSPPRD
jgi:hypothetical protein